MEGTAFDVFINVKNILSLGNYQAAVNELSSTDINEEEIVQVIKKKFYLFLSYIEDDNQKGLNELLAELKECKDQQKLYYNIFRFYTVFVIKGQYKEEVLEKMFKDIISLENPGMILQPAIYIISLILLELDDREKFLQLSDKLPNDSEILGLKIFYFLKLNRFKEAEQIIDKISQRDPDSTLIQTATILLYLFRDANIEGAISLLAELKRNNQVSPKIFNLISVTLMFKNNFKEALKPLLYGIEICQKNEIASKDLQTMFVNLICCYRNLGMDDEVRDSEEKLRNLNPRNSYFAKLKAFEDEFEKIIA